MTPFRFQKLGVIPYQRTGKELRVGGAAPAQVQQPYDDPTFFTQPILMQGLSSECGGFSLAFALAYLLNQQVSLSGSFAYAFEKTVDGVPNEAGTTIAAVGKAAQQEGTCLNALFPDDGNVTTDPNGAATSFDVATAQAIQDALTRAGLIPLFLTDLSWNGIQSAIAKYKCVILEAEVGEEWYTNAEGADSWAAADVLPIRPPKSVIDAHFFVAGGKFDAQDTWFANEWSAEWAQNGFGYFQENYIPYIKNALVLVKAPPSVQVVVNEPSIPQETKASIIQQIIDDIEQAVGLISQELGQL
jgi:hypothetical protein